MEEIISSSKSQRDTVAAWYFKFQTNGMENVAVRDLRNWLLTWNSPWFGRSPKASEFHCKFKCLLEIVGGKSF